MEVVKSAEASDRNVLFHIEDDGVMYCEASLDTEDGFGGEDGSAALPRHLSRYEIDKVIQIMLTCERRDFWTVFELIEEGRLPLAPNLS